MQLREVLYLGDDLRLAEQLTQQLADTNIQVVPYQTTGDIPPQVAEYGDRVLMLDMDLESHAGMHCLHDLKSGEASHLPVIVVSERLSMTALGIARLNGAEATFFKPIADWPALCDAVLAAQRKLQQWHRTIAYLGGLSQRLEEKSRSEEDVDGVPQEQQVASVS